MVLFNSSQIPNPIDPSPTSTSTPLDENLFSDLTHLPISAIAPATCRCCIDASLSPEIPSRSRQISKRKKKGVLQKELNLRRPQLKVSVKNDERIDGLVAESVSSEEKLEGIMGGVMEKIGRVRGAVSEVSKLRKKVARKRRKAAENVNLSRGEV
ncbi:hypothetical protein Syun_030030 [Stephania yunnanensis]|uniref:Uncharacterized protein n=1 Tax=Stephania yunnanensis TaxID=152371 RepID=A0AAP0E6Q4_9MAGN